MIMNENMMIVPDEGENSKNIRDLTCQIEQYIWTDGIRVVLDGERISLLDLIKCWRQQKEGE